MENIEEVSSEIWKELEEASKVEPPLNIKPYYDDMVKREDPISKEVGLQKTVWNDSAGIQATSSKV